jgi:hypothetical protein
MLIIYVIEARKIMGSCISDIKQNLDELIMQGKELYYSLNFKHETSDKKKKILDKYKLNADKLPNFHDNYEIWYTGALHAVKILIPERVDDFIQLYKNDKRKNLVPITYTVSDAVLGIYNEHNHISPLTALPKFSQQLSILKSARKNIDNVIYNLQFFLRADLFDSELSAANELLKSGFLRAAGVMCGVVLEKHLKQVCIQHKIIIKKKTPGLSYFNEELKTASIIDISMWRQIQYLDDIRNICCHNKSNEPTKEQVKDLLDGTTKVVKSLN